MSGETIANDPNGINGAVNYSYDPVGNRTQLTSTLAPVPAGLWNYDANDRFTAGDTYDANGNTISSGGIGVSYDFENRLIQKGGVTLIYDGDGNRVAKTIGGVTTRYLVANSNPTGYPQVIAEATVNGAPTAPYVYGLERISQKRTVLINGSNTTQIRYFDYDGHGSVRALTDTTGNVTDTYDYDAFGNLIHSTGTTQNVYLYSGEQFDSDLNLYYNRARYLNVSTGRFWSMDSFEGDFQSPQSLHKYLYASADPVNRIDPDGQQDFVSEIAAEADTEILASIAIVSTVAAVCSIDFALGGNHCINREPEQDRTFYHGTSGYVADLIVAEQRVDPEAIQELGNSNADYGLGFYMSEQLSTARFYADLRGGYGQSGGPGIVRVDISAQNWKRLVLLGAVDTTAVSRLIGQTQAFVPIYLIDLFNGLKTQFSLAK